MSKRVDTRKKQIDRMTVIKKKFYVEAYTDIFNPTGALRLYRMTRGTTKARSSPFFYQSVRIKTPEELAKVKPQLDYLAGKINWKDLPPLVKTLEKQLRQEKEIHPEILRIVRQYPKTSIGWLKAFDKVFNHMEIDDFPLIVEFMQTSIHSLKGKQEMMVNLQLDLIKRLAKEKTPQGHQRLLKLLNEYSLPQLTSVSSIITDRIQRLKIFKAQIQNEKAYEIRGENSIHNQLANALWILDESYWLLHSNEPLTNFLEKEFKSATKREKERPDFICANDKDDLVIVEIKRPSHSVTQKDINQLQNYLVSVDEYKPNLKSKYGFIIAKKLSQRLQKIIADIRNIEFRSYVDLVSDSEMRYREYLDAIKKPK